jgi:hypothetical protein
MRRTIMLVTMVLLVTASVAGAKGQFPNRIALPNGWAPEGIAISPGGTFYSGSIPTGAIYRGSLRTGKGAVFIPAQAGRQAVGLSHDGRGRLFVAGGPTGDGYVYDARTGGTLRTYDFASSPPATFVNDVVATRTAAYFTESNRPVLYRVALGPGGAPGASFQTLNLTGDYVQGPGFNVNGIDATPDGRTLVIVQSGTGKLFTVAPRTGVAKLIDLGGATVTNGDGILLDGRTLYVVRNQNNLIAVVLLSRDFGSGRIVREVTNPGFSVPTTIDDFGDRLYAINARFGTPVTPSTEYWITGLKKPRG